MEILYKFFSGAAAGLAALFAPVVPLADNHAHPVRGAVVDADELNLPVGHHGLHLVIEHPDLQYLRVKGRLQHRVGQGGALAV